MDAQLAAYSPEFRQFIQQVETALVQAAVDARELAERTGTPLVVQETGEQMGLEPASHMGDKIAKEPARAKIVPSNVSVG